MRWIPLVVALLCLWVIPAAAVQPDEILSDSQLEARARTLTKELRCMVCQNQSIDELGRAACSRLAPARPRASAGRRFRTGR